MSDPAQIPLWYCVQLGHAAVQWVAGSNGLEVLHVKGAALDSSILTPLRDGTRDGSPTDFRVPRRSTDADILVRPAHARGLIQLLVRQGWRIITEFETGSAFQHAASLWHPYLGYVDVHRLFPGIGLEPAAAFDRLWADHHLVDIAHQPCPVPSVTAQRVLLLLHAARGGRESDKSLVWGYADPWQRREAEALVAELKAQVAFAAATGTLDHYRDSPEHDLWELYSSHHEADRWAEWRARFKATRGLRGRVGVLTSMLRVNRGHLEMELGHQPSRREMLWATLRRFRRAAQGLWGRKR